MKLEWLIASVLFYVGLTALYYFLRSYVNTTVNKSIEHQFDLKLETFKQGFARDLHAIDRKDKFRLAALDKRLEVHQNAYKIAVNLRQTVHGITDERLKVYNEFSEFWDNNCLFLSNNSRIAIWNSAMSYLDYPVFLQMRRENPKDQETKEDLKRLWERITQAPDIIMESVDTEFLAIEPRTSDGKIITMDGIEERKDSK